MFLIAVSVSTMSVTHFQVNQLLAMLRALKDGCQWTTTDCLGMKKPAEPCAVRVLWTSSDCFGMVVGGADGLEHLAVSPSMTEAR